VSVVVVSVVVVSVVVVSVVVVSVVVVSVVVVSVVVVSVVVVGVVTEMTDTCEMSLPVEWSRSESDVKVWISGPSPCWPDPAFTHTSTVAPSGMSKCTVFESTTVMVTPSIVSGRAPKSTFVPGHTSSGAAPAVLGKVAHAIMSRVAAVTAIRPAVVRRLLSLVLVLREPIICSDLPFALPVGTTG
jgi:hypothetical protein